MTEAIVMTPVGHVRARRREPDDDHWGAERAEIVIDSERFSAEALAGLGDFSHVEVLFHFHQASPESVETGARHPRGNKAWPKVGIFAQRGKDRPNRIGATICEVLSVDGTTLTVRGLDAIDGTPVLDIKPVMSGFLPRGTLMEPFWAKELMRRYW